MRLYAGPSKLFIQDTKNHQIRLKLRQAFYESDDPIKLASCAYLHNYHPRKDDPIFRPRYQAVTKETPVFTEKSLRSESITTKSHRKNTRNPHGYLVCERFTLRRRSARSIHPCSGGFKDRSQLGNLIVNEFAEYLRRACGRNQI